VTNSRHDKLARKGEPGRNGEYGSVGRYTNVGAGAGRVVTELKGIIDPRVCEEKLLTSAN